MLILGLNAFHGDSSACIIKDGQLIAAVDEERFTRIKHWAGFPAQAIQYCLDEAGVSIQEVDHLAINRDVSANVTKKIFYALTHKPIQLISDRLKNAGKVVGLKELICEEFKIKPSEFKAEIHHVEHHLAHLASSFYVSPYEKALCLSIDGFGDFVGSMWGIGEGKSIEVKNRTFFPHSIGQYYLALTQFLGFKNYGDEYKVMGLSAYGEPKYLDEMREILKQDNFSEDNLFQLELKYFQHHTKGAGMEWDNGSPTIQDIFSEKMCDLLGPSREKGDELTQKHMDIASSMQRRFEEVVFKILNRLHEVSGLDTLCLSGGCALNSLANGKLYLETPFKELYIPPAPADGGGSVGAAFEVLHGKMKQDRKYEMWVPYFGPSYDKDSVESVLSESSRELEAENCSVEELTDLKKLCEMTADQIIEGNVIGWFQDRMEWGPRALGNRSILADPRRDDMKEILNLKIKRREAFRPFAPSILEDYVDDYFEQDHPDPFMVKVYKIREKHRENLPAVTHVDGTGRLQSVSRKINDRYYTLIDTFREKTGTPILVNTSFNENEPVVCTPREALNCFLRTKMDVLVLNNHFIRRKS